MLVEITRIRLLRLLDTEYQELWKRHYDSAPRGHPIGGGDWMDLFFRMEAVRGCMGGLRTGKSLEESIRDGKAVSEIAVQIWNGKREYQVRRWDKTAHDFLENLVYRLYRQAREIAGCS